MSHVTFYCENINSIDIGTDVLSAVGNIGVVIDIDNAMRDVDGSYGKGFVVLWEHGGMSMFPKSDLDTWYKHKVIFSPIMD